MILNLKEKEEIMIQHQNNEDVAYILRAKKGDIVFSELRK